MSGINLDGPKDVEPLRFYCIHFDSEDSEQPTQSQPCSIGLGKNGYQVNIFLISPRKLMF